MKKKIVFLFLALVLPGLVFVFLKQFGKNEFTIPIYYEQAADSLNAACGTHYAGPYSIPDSLLSTTGWRAGLPSLFVLDSAVIRSSEFNRLTYAFDEASIQTIGVNPAVMGETLFRRWYACVLMVKPTANVVLVDREKRIRGYYAVGSREEVDRLIVELQILLSKY